MFKVLLEFVLGLVMLYKKMSQIFYPRTYWFIFGPYKSSVKEKKDRVFEAFFWDSMILFAIIAIWGDFVFAHKESILWRLYPAFPVVLTAVFFLIPMGFGLYHRWQERAGKNEEKRKL